MPEGGGGLAREPALPATSSPESALAALRGVIREGKVTRQLAEIAFLGAFCGQARAAETVFEGLRRLCPGNPHVELGLAMVWAISGRPKEGMALLERIPPSDDALQGLVSLCTGLLLNEAGHRSAANKKFTESIARGGTVAELARALSDTAGR